ncbi:nuclear transport factor 2 family protein [Nocardia rhamnosiphila]
MSSAPSGIDLLTSKEEIRDVIYQWSRGVARKDWVLVRSCYTDDAVDNHGSVNGGVDGFIEWMESYHSTIEEVIFYSTNILIEFVDVDTAFVESHGISFQRHSAAAKEARVTFLGPDWADKNVPIAIDFAGRKLDTFVRRDGVWRIAARNQVYESINARVAGPAKIDAPDFRVSRRDPQDALFDARVAAGLSRRLSL